MRKKIINKLMSIIEKEKKLDKVTYEKIEYGLISIYILITKLIFIFIVAYFLGIFKEMLIFLLIFNGIRLFAFGLHATKSYICLIVSTLAFIGLPYLSTIIEINFTFKLILGIILIGLMFKNSPADTHKRPIVNKNRRLFFKIASTSVAIIYVILALYLSNFISNCLLLSLLLEAIFISPLTYRLFNLPYNNYLKYIEKEELNVI